MDLIQGLLFITPIFLLAIASPTPDFILVSQQTLSNGKKAGYACTLGIILGVALHIAFAAISLVFMLAYSPTLIWAIKLLGAVFLIVFGLMVLKASLSKHKAKNEAVIEKQTYLKSFAIGFLGNVFNPLAPLFFISLFTIALSADTPPYYIVVYGVWMLVLDFSRFILLIKLLSISKIYKKFQQWGVWIDRVLAASLIVFGGVLISGIGR